MKPIPPSGPSPAIALSEAPRSDRACGETPQSVAAAEVADHGDRIEIGGAGLIFDRARSICWHGAPASRAVLIAEASATNPHRGWPPAVRYELDGTSLDRLIGWLLDIRKTLISEQAHHAIWRRAAAPVPSTASPEAGAADAGDSAVDETAPDEAADEADLQRLTDRCMRMIELSGAVSRLVVDLLECSPERLEEIGTTVDLPALSGLGEWTRAGTDGPPTPTARRL